MRYRDYPITPELLVSMFEQDNEIHAVIEDGIPHGARVVHVYIDTAGTGWPVIVLRIEHESFDDVEMGSTVPRFTCRAKTAVAP